MFEWLANRFVKGYPQTDDPKVQKRLIFFSSVLGIVLNLLLVGAKLVIGTLINSLAVISDGINNLMDTAGAMVAAVGAYLSNRPEDKEHPFGHGRYEYLASFLISFLILFVGIELFRRGVGLIRAPQPIEVSGVAIGIMLLSILVKAWMVLYNRLIDRKVQSTLNDGIAKDSMNDILATAGVLVSLLLYAFMGINADGPASLIISLFVCKAGWDLLRDTTNNLLGQDPDRELVQSIENILLEGRYVKGYHDLVVHDYGRGKLLASAHVDIPRNIGVVEIHDEVDWLEQRVLEETHVELVLHMDPNYVFQETQVKSGAEAVQEAAGRIRAGELVAFPTETVYGLGADGLNAKACNKIFDAKERPRDNPLILHIAEGFPVDSLVTDIPENGKKLMDAFWPGPLTLVFSAKEHIPKVVTGGGDTVGIRMPSHPVAQAILKEAGVPVAAPSANRSGSPSPTDANAVLADLKRVIPLIIDGGETGIGLESTVVDVTQETPVLLRPGFVTPEDLQGVVGEIQVDPSLEDETQTPRSPGQKYRHYAPKAEVVLYTDPDAMRKDAERDRANGKTVAVLSFSQDSQAGDDSLGTKDDLSVMAHRLFRCLRAADAQGADRIYAPEVPKKGWGLAIMNRLEKAAGGRK